MAGLISRSPYVRVIGGAALDAKLLAASPRILAHNRLMVTSMLDYIKPAVIGMTPVGPGHFGYHLRDTYTTDVRSEGIKSTGVLKSPQQGYWREFGTKRGERAFRTAHIALTGARRIIRIFYGGMAAWWRI